MSRSFSLRRPLPCITKSPRDNTLSRSRPRPAVSAAEALEGRTLLATFTVLNLADDGGGSLRQAVLDANALPGADTIVFADDLSGSIVLSGGQLSITDDLTVDGPGAGQLAVSGNQQSRIFAIGVGKRVAIDDLTITDGRAAGDGGAILNTGGSLALDRVVLSNNSAVATTAGANGRGGAVANLARATLTVTDSLFSRNQVRGADFGPAGPQLVASGAGVLNLSSRLTVTRTTFSENEAIGGAGGGRAQGGGINSAVDSTTLISDSVFVGNRALAGDGGGGTGLGRAGAVFNDASVMTIEDSSIVGNLARGGANIAGRGFIVGNAGGAGITNSDRGVLRIRRTTVRGNLAVGGSNNSSSGGEGDIGTAFGGGLANVGEATITDSVFEDNEARGGSGGRGSGGGFQFVGTATGGGIFTAARNSSGTPATLTLDRVTLRGNRAVGGDGNTAGTVVNAGIGGALGNNGSNPSFSPPAASTVILRDSTLSHNRALGGAGGAALGGGIANVLGGVVRVEGGTVRHNRAQGGDGAAGGDGGSAFGGGIYNEAASTHPSNVGASTVLTVSRSSVAHNHARGGAGASGGAGGDGQGGGLWNGGAASVLDSGLERNMALGGDGGGEAKGGDGLGGGIFNDVTASLLLERSAVTGNHANGGNGGIGGAGGVGIGGGIYNLGTVDLEASTLINANHASTTEDDVFLLL